MPKSVLDGQTEKRLEAIWVPQFTHPNRKPCTCPFLGVVLRGEEDEGGEEGPPSPRSSRVVEDPE